MKSGPICDEHEISEKHLQVETAN